MRTKMLLATFAVSMVATAAAAEDTDKKGFYIAGGVGVATLQSTDIGYYDAGGTFGGTGAQDRVDGKLRFKSAAEFGATLGYDFGRVRFDVQVSYTRNSIKSLEVLTLNGSPVTLDAGDIADICDYLEAASCGGTGNTISFDGGKVRRASGLANLWVDFPVAKGITPYVGGGIGVAGFEVDGEGKASFAWQLGAGAAFHVANGVAITLDYRFRNASGARIEYDAASGFDIGRQKSQSFGAGLRFTF
ncbi:outer membrane protein [Sandarakinorhabdus oryzae]|uniref:outer membrane protein n=1 Tax=Sandarakinorhabdus oryzae TaxID=2675220 RepID=UPI0012E2BE85|nr:outer membrane beta-barrel protein [Sandarakinorhabdus oryzae]